MSNSFVLGDVANQKKVECKSNLDFVFVVLINNNLDSAIPIYNFPNKNIYIEKFC